jgi:hypothetical protein
LLPPPIPRSLLDSFPPASSASSFPAAFFFTSDGSRPKTVERRKSTSEGSVTGRWCTVVDSIFLESAQNGNDDVDDDNNTSGNVDVGDVDGDVDGGGREYLVERTP